MLQALGGSAVTVVATVTVIVMRVPGANLMLDQQQRDTGSAAALIQFFGMIMGAVCMFLVSLDPDSLIENLGTIQMVVGFTGSVLWLILFYHFSIL